MNRSMVKEYFGDCMDFQEHLDFSHKKLKNWIQQNWAALAFTAKIWCIFLFLKNLMSIFNLEQDGVVLLRDDLFKVRRHQCFILENYLKII